MDSWCHNLKEYIKKFPTSIYSDKCLEMDMKNMLIVDFSQTLACNRLGEYLGRYIYIYIYELV